MRERRAACLLLLAAFVVPAAAEAQNAVIVVRHAENKGDKLTEAGVRRAERLASMLRGAGVTAIYSTDTKRTIGTATPLSKALEVPIRIYGSGGGQAPIDATAFVRQLARDHSGDIVLVVGHSDTIPDLLKALRCPGEVTIAPDSHDDLFVVVPEGDSPPTLVRLKY